MSDVLNGTDVMEETINGEDEWIIIFLLLVHLQVFNSDLAQKGNKS